MTSKKLNEAALQSLPDNVVVPAYDRSKLKAGILHIGVGNFHRAHQAVYLNELFSLGQDHDWALVGAGIKPYDVAMRDRLQHQDWLTTVVELDPNGLTAKISGSMVDFVEIDPQAVVERLSSPEIRIVSLTITEGGYFVNEVTGGFDHKHPEIMHDVEHPDTPETVFGVLIAAIRKRRSAGIAPFTVMSCDNLPENGKIARQAVLGLAMDMSSDLGDWIEQNVSFPNSMVDCITPATSDRERAMVKDRFGIIDAAPVACEPFRQWVMEDKFPNGRPALEKVGVEFVADVAPYELMKLRILNGGHATIAYPSALMGYHFVHDGMADPLVNGFLAKLEVSEIIPTVPSVPGVNFMDYLAKVSERFSNSAVGDTIPRLCLDGSNRQPKFILPAITDRLENGQTVDGLALEVALWCRYCAGTDDAGNAIELVDEKAARLTQHALQAKDNPAAFLAMTDIFGPLSENATFAAAFSQALNALWSNGTKATLQAYLA